MTENSFPFWGLMAFTFILFIAPQTFWPLLRTLRIAMVTAGVALLIYALDRLFGGRPLTVMIPAVRSLFWFVTLALISIPFSRWPGGAWDVFFGELLKSVLILILVANTVDTVARMKVMIGSMVLWSVVMSWSAVNDFSQGNFQLRGIRISGYESPLAANPNDLALILNLILALMIGLYYAARGPLAKLVCLTAVGLLVAGVITSFSRGGFLTMATVAIVFLIIRVRTRGLAAVGWAILALILAVCLMPQGYGDRIATIFDNKADATGSADARWNTMLFAWAAMLDNPLLGFGIGQHSLYFTDRTGDWNWTGVHNVFLQIGADLGVPALLAYVVVIYQLFKALRRAQARLEQIPSAQELRELGRGIFTALIAYLIGAFFAPIAYQFYFFYVAGLAIAFEQIAIRTHQEASEGNEAFGDPSPSPTSRWWGGAAPHEKRSDRT